MAPSGSAGSSGDESVTFPTVYDRMSPGKRRCLMTGITDVDTVAP
jgi:hypothetical protein